MYSKCPWFLTQNRHKIKKKNSPPPQTVHGRHTEHLGRLGCFHRKHQTLAMGGFIKCQEEEVLTPFHGYAGLGRERHTLPSGLFREYPSNWEAWASLPSPEQGSCVGIHTCSMSWDSYWLTLNNESWKMFLSPVVVSALQWWPYS